MKVLILFERSGHVREAFKQKGHDATSIDIVESMIPGQHIIMDIRTITHEFIAQYDMLIMFPPCTYFSSYNRYLIKNNSTRIQKREEDLNLIKYLWKSPVKHIAMENPANGSLKHLFKQMSQDIQPYYFGDNYQKKTGLWLKNLPLLMPTQIDLNYIKDWTESHSTKLERIITPKGLAAAMAEQWGELEGNT